jgi:uncharacterized protein YacL
MPKHPTPALDRTETSVLFSNVLNVVRLVFILALISVGWSLVSPDRGTASATTLFAARKDLVMIGFAAVAVVFIGLDVLIPRKSLGSISGLFFGLIVGMVIAYALSLIVDLIAETMYEADLDKTPIKDVVSAIKLGIGVICCYLSVSFVLQTKDDVRFVIPYVEFSKQMKGARPLVLDTSVIVDGRIADISSTGIFQAEMIVPRFVLQELQTIADSKDKLKRARGRRGLDMLNALQSNEAVDVRILDVEPARSAQGMGVDEMLIDLALELNGRVVTNDYNLNKTAKVRGVPIVNINDLANALKPVVLPGEMLRVKVIKPGEEVGQGVGYLEDGTMVVAEGGRDRIGDTIDLTVTSVLQTSAGRMIFGRLDGVDMGDRRRPRSR